MVKETDITLFRHLYPFKSNYIDIEGIKLHYIDEGTGDPVVMIHGNPTWSFFFRKLIKAISGSFRAIAPDHIGCGLSDKPGTQKYDYRLKSRVEDLETLLNHLGLNKITLILHDWGGMIGMAYALRHIEKIHRIVLMNTAAFLPPKGRPLPLRLKLIRDFKFLAVPAVLGLNLFSMGAVYMASHKKLAKDVKAGLTAPYNCWENRIATLKFVQDIPVGPKDHSYKLVRQVDQNLYKLKNVPILICWGMHDFVFDADYLDQWRLRFPNASIHTFPDAGHYVLEDVPEKITPLIKAFLTQ